MHRIAASVFSALLVAFPVAAQDTYPSKPITLVVPYAPGGGSDFLGRTLAEGLHTRLNQTVLVQNLAGAGSVVGSQ
jgi:tripartite-type tricarboxylate transporter receptor subunit TctC